MLRKDNGNKENARNGLQKQLPNGPLRSLNVSAGSLTRLAAGIVSLLNMLPAAILEYLLLDILLLVNYITFFLNTLCTMAVILLL